MTTDPVLHGSCLCGGVRYAATGQAQRFYHCHCKRCRKVSGGAHASNLFLAGTLEWESGENLISSFKLPEAKRFTNSFCRNCGARVPRFIEAMGMVMIPAGSLDDEPDISPQARIFTGSRAEWSCDSAEIPEFPEYPSSS